MEPLFKYLFLESLNKLGLFLLFIFILTCKYQDQFLFYLIKNNAWSVEILI